MALAGFGWRGDGEEGGSTTYLEAAGDQRLAEEWALGADDAAVASDLLAGAEADFEVAVCFGLPETGEKLAKGFLERIAEGWSVTYSSP